MASASTHVQCAVLLGRAERLCSLRLGALTRSAGRAKSRSARRRAKLSSAAFTSSGSRMSSSLQSHACEAESTRAKQVTELPVRKGVRRYQQRPKRGFCSKARQTCRCRGLRSLLASEPGVEMIASAPEAAAAPGLLWRGWRPPWAAAPAHWTPPAQQPQSTPHGAAAPHSCKSSQKPCWRWPSMATDSEVSTTGPSCAPPLRRPRRYSGWTVSTRLASASSSSCARLRGSGGWKAAGGAGGRGACRSYRPAAALAAKHLS
jgi:hypothetical protein